MNKTDIDFTTSFARRKFPFPLFFVLKEMKSSLRGQIWKKGKTGQSSLENPREEIPLFGLNIERVITKKRLAKKPSF